MSVLQRLQHGVHGRGEGQVQRGLPQDLSDCHEREDLQPHCQGLQETPREALWPTGSNLYQNWPMICSSLPASRISGGRRERRDGVSDDIRDRVYEQERKLFRFRFTDKYSSSQFLLTLKVEETNILKLINKEHSAGSWSLVPWPPVSRWRRPSVRRTGAGWWRENPSALSSWWRTLSTSQVYNWASPLFNWYCCRGDLHHGPHPGL